MAEAVDSPIDHFLPLADAEVMAARRCRKHAHPIRRRIFDRLGAEPEEAVHLEAMEVRGQGCSPHAQGRRQGRLEIGFQAARRQSYVGTCSARRIREKVGLGALRGQNPKILA